MTRCACCGQEGELRARGLRASCLARLTREGTLDELYPRKTRTRAQMLEDWQILKARGLTKRQASVHMGYAPRTLEDLLLRAGKAGLL